MSNAAINFSLIYLRKNVLLNILKLRNKNKISKKNIQSS